MKAIGYVRVSTEKQADLGISLEAQTEKIRAMAVVQGVELLEIIFDAGESAKSLDRSGMSKLMALVNAKAIDSVIVAKLDRLTRSVKDLAELLECFGKRGVSLVSLAESLDTRTASGRLLLNLLTSVSQWEREAIGERTRDALCHKKAKCERVGNIQFGYRLAADGVRLELKPAEQQMISFIRQRAAVGMSTRAIAADLNRLGYRTRRGSQWSGQYIWAMLKQKSFAEGSL